MKADSFFNIFEDIDPDTVDKKKSSEEEEDDEEDEMSMKLQNDLETADQLKDDFIPLAIEYYLGVIEKEEPDDDSDEMGDDDSDDDKPKKKKGKKG